MIAVDQFLGTAAYGTVAVVPAVMANAGQTVQLVRAPRIAGVSPLFLLLATINQALWLTWAVLVSDAGTTVAAAAAGVGAALNLTWWIARITGLPPADHWGHRPSGRVTSGQVTSAVADPGSAL
jgi:uncharacterized protein with PQ loop repeat